MTFGTLMPGYWYADRDMVPGSDDLPLAEAEIEANLKEYPDLPIERVKAKGAKGASQKRVKAAPQGEEGAVSPDEVLAEALGDPVAPHDSGASEEVEGEKA